MAKKIIKKSSKAKTSELDNLSFADGKINEDPDISKIKELEKAFGIEKSNPFGTSNLEVFKETLSEMTNIDMQHMCEKIGIFASGSRQDIKSKLLREFKSTHKGSVSVTSQRPVLELDPTNPDHKELLKILGEI
jgi:hypothetical protein